MNLEDKNKEKSEDLNKNCQKKAILQKALIVTSWKNDINNLLNVINNIIYAYKYYVYFK
jgi:hypothetical protein